MNVQHKSLVREIDNKCTQEEINGYKERNIFGNQKKGTRKEKKKKIFAPK